MTIISIESFGGNKDNYYNFKRNFLNGRESLRKCDLYLSPVVPLDVPIILGNAFGVLRDIEFED